MSKRIVFLLTFLFFAISIPLPVSYSRTSTGRCSWDPSWDEKFAIPRIVKEQHVELVCLIVASTSMNDEEREYWFQIIPIMTESQRAELTRILRKEVEGPSPAATSPPPGERPAATDADTAHEPRRRVGDSGRRAQATHEVTCKPRGAECPLRLRTAARGSKTVARLAVGTRLRALTRNPGGWLEVEVVDGPFAGAQGFLPAKQLRLAFDTGGRFAPSMLFEEVLREFPELAKIHERHRKAVPFVLISWSMDPEERYRQLLGLEGMTETELSEFEFEIEKRFESERRAARENRPIEVGQKTLERVERAIRDAGIPQRTVRAYPNLVFYALAALDREGAIESDYDHTMGNLSKMTLYQAGFVNTVSICKLYGVSCELICKRYQVDCGERSTPEELSAAEALVLAGVLVSGVAGLVGDGGSTGDGGVASGGGTAKLDIKISAPGALGGAVSHCRVRVTVDGHGYGDEMPCRFEIFVPKKIGYYDVCIAGVVGAGGEHREGCARTTGGYVGISAE